MHRVHLMPDKKQPPDADDEKVVEQPEGVSEHDEHTDTPEEIEHKMHVGDVEVDMYSTEGRDELMEDDEITELEQGFAEGEDNPELAHCAGCGKVLSQDESKIIEREIDHKTALFCSDACASAGIQHGKKN